MKVVLTSLSLAISLSFAGYALRHRQEANLFPPFYLRRKSTLEKPSWVKNCTLIRAYPSQGLSRVTHAIT